MTPCITPGPSLRFLGTLNVLLIVVVLFPEIQRVVGAVLGRGLAVVAHAGGEGQQLVVADEAGAAGEHVEPVVDQRQRAHVRELLQLGIPFLSDIFKLSI